MNNVKIAILELVITEVETQIANSEKGLRTSKEDAQSHKGAMQSRYDTFKEEAQYLMGGFDTQIKTLNRTLEALRQVRKKMPATSKGSGYALIETCNQSAGKNETFFLLPAGGGNSYNIEGQEIMVLNVGAPLARAFFGKVAGDEVVFTLQDKQTRYTVISVS